MDKSFFEIYSFDDARPDPNYWMKKTAKERWIAFWKLNCFAHGIDINNPPGMDKTIFDIRSRE